MWELFPCCITVQKEMCIYSQTREKLLSKLMFLEDAADFCTVLNIVHVHPVH